MTEIVVELSPGERRALHVKRVAELLDDDKPGWENQLNLDMVVFSSNTRCVIGQLYGHTRKCPEWSTIASRFPLAVLSGGSIPLWEQEIEARGGKPTRGLMFPEQWTRKRTGREWRPRVRDPYAEGRSLTA